MRMLRIYEHFGRNPGIIYWQIRQPVNINTINVYHIGKSAVLLSLKCEDQIYILTTAPAFSCFLSSIHIKGRFGL
jgi:hypothetical protein